MNVPCNGCRLCCIRESIPLQSWERHDAETMPNGARLLEQKANGECVYLGETGCAIHGKAPIACQQFDCRERAGRYGYTEARKAVNERRVSLAVLNKGRALLGKPPFPILRRGG